MFFTGSFRRDCDARYFRIGIKPWSKYITQLVVDEVRAVLLQQWQANDESVLLFMLCRAIFYLKKLTKAQSHYPLL